MAKMKIGELSKEIDDGTIKSANESITRNGALIEEISNKIIKEHISDLDTFVDKITDVLNDEKSPNLTSEELEQALLRLTTLLYYAVDKAESVGIKADISTAVRKEVYNAAIVAVEGTINEKTAKADDESISERIVEIAYNRAYNKIKNRIQIGLEMQATLKKIMSRRMESVVKE